MDKPFKAKLVLSAGLIFFILDRVIKKLLIHQILPNNRVIKYTQNSGIAFGLNLPEAFLIITTIFLILSLTVWFIRSWQANNKFEASLFFLILLGGYSNLIDRFSYNFVVDYIDLQIWPIFNIADILIVVGVMILIILKVNSPRRDIVERHHRV